MIDGEIDRVCSPDGDTKSPGREPTTAPGDTRPNALGRGFLADDCLANVETAKTHANPATRIEPVHGTQPTNVDVMQSDTHPIIGRGSNAPTTLQNDYRDYTSNMLEFPEPPRSEEAADADIALELVSHLYEAVRAPVSPNAIRPAMKHVAKETARKASAAKNPDKTNVRMDPPPRLSGERTVLGVPPKSTNTNDPPTSRTKHAHHSPIMSHMPRSRPLRRRAKESVSSLVRSPTSPKLPHMRRVRHSDPNDLPPNRSQCVHLTRSKLSSVARSTPSATRSGICTEQHSQSDFFKVVSCASRQVLQPKNSDGK